jgi:hypothetical protein
MSKYSLLANDTNLGEAVKIPKGVDSGIVPVNTLVGARRMLIWGTKGLGSGGYPRRKHPEFVNTNNIMLVC